MVVKFEKIRNAAYISNLRLTSASIDFRNMLRSAGSVQTSLIFEHFLLFRVFRLSRYLSIQALV